MKTVEYGQFSAYTREQNAEAIAKVRELMTRPDSARNFSPSARYAVSQLLAYAMQERQYRQSCEQKMDSYLEYITLCMKMLHERDLTVTNLKQQLSFAQQVLADTGV